MKFTLVTPDKTVFDRIFPPHIAKMAMTEDAITIGIIDDDDLASIAVLRKNPCSTDSMILEYIYTLVECDRESCTMALLKHCESFLRGCGIRTLSIKTCGTPDCLKQGYDFLVPLGFYPATLTGHLSGFKLISLIKSPLMTKISALKEYTKDIVSFPDMNAEPIIDLQRRSMETGFLFSREGYDSSLCRYYVRDGVIKAAILVEKIDDKTLYCSDAYTAPDIPFQAVLPSLIAVVIVNAAKTMPHDSHIVIETILTKGYLGITKLFGQPEKDYLIQEYARSIAADDDINPFTDKSDCLTIDQIRDSFEAPPVSLLPSFENAQPLFLGEPREPLFTKCLTSISYYFPSVQFVQRSIMLFAMLEDRSRNYDFGKELENYRADLNRWFEEIGRPTLTENDQLPFGTSHTERFVKEYYSEPGIRFFEASKGIAYRSLESVGADISETSGSSFLGFSNSNAGENGISIGFDYGEPRFDGLRYFVFDNGSKELIDVLPEFLHGIYSDPSLCGIGCLDADDQLIAYVCFTKSPVSPRYVFLERIYVIPEYRGHGIATKLVRKLTAFCRQNGSTMVSSFLFGKAPTIEPGNLFLTKCGFVPVITEGHCMLYYLQDIVATRFAKLLLKDINSLPDVYTVSGDSDPLPKRFGAFTKDEDFFFDAANYDKKYTKFIVRDDEIVAAICAEKLTSKLVFIRDIYVDSEYDPKVFVGSLLAHLFQDCYKTLGEEAAVILSLYNGTTYRAFSEYLGEGEQNLLLQQLTLPLNEKTVSDTDISLDRMPAGLGIDRMLFRILTDSYDRFTDISFANRRIEDALSLTRNSRILCPKAFQIARNLEKQTLSEFELDSLVIGQTSFLHDVESEKKRTSESFNLGNCKTIADFKPFFLNDVDRSIEDFNSLRNTFMSFVDSPSPAGLVKLRLEAKAYNDCRRGPRYSKRARQRKAVATKLANAIK